MSSRRYIKRVWRVPKDRGAPTYLAFLVVKALVKHGWPAKFDLLSNVDGFQLSHFYDGFDVSADFWDAVDAAVRIAVRTYKIDVTQEFGNVMFHKSYTVTDGGFFKEV